MILAVVGVAVVGGSLAVAFGGRRVGPAIGVVGLLLTFALALGLPIDDPLTIGGVALLSGEPVKAWVVLLTGLGVGLGAAALLLPAADTATRRTPAALLFVVGPAALAVAATDDATSVLAATAAGCAVGLLTGSPAGERKARALEDAAAGGRDVGRSWRDPGRGRRRPGAAAAPGTALREVRAAVSSGALGLLAIAILAGSVGVAVGAPVVGVAFLAVGLAVVVRSGAVPAHGWAARLPDVAGELAIPIALAMTPALVVSALLAWSAASIVPLDPSLGFEAAILVGIGLATLALGGLAAATNDDLGHVIAYAAIADAGIAILALGAIDPLASEAVPTWLTGHVAAKCALGLWLAALRSRYGTRDLRAASGWIRRSPELGVVFVVAAVASIGWPGLAIFEARSTIVGAAVGDAVFPLALAVALFGLVYLGRILVIGLGQSGSATIALGPGRTLNGSGLDLVRPNLARRPAGAGATPSMGSPAPSMAGAAAPESPAPDTGAVPAVESLSLRGRQAAGRAGVLAAAGSRRAGRVAARSAAAGMRVGRRAGGALWRDRPALLAVDAFIVALFALAVAAGSLGIDAPTAPIDGTSVISPPAVVRE